MDNPTSSQTSETIHPLPDETPEREEVQPLIDLDPPDEASVQPEASKTPPAEEPSTPKPPDPQQRTLTEEEYETLMRKGDVYDLINNDPELSSYVADVIRARSGQTGSQQKSPPQGEASDLESRLAAAERRAEEAEQAARQAAAAVSVANFRAQNPDLDNFETEITQMIRDYNMDLPTAYQHAKAMRAAAGNNGAPQPRPSAAPAEGRGTVTTPSGESSLLEEAAKQINDPKRRVSTGDALDIAFAAATKHFNNQE